MEVILLSQIEKLGEEHEVVAVKSGYARNYLIPQKLAIAANDTNRKVLDHKIKQAKLREEELKKEMAVIAEKLTNSVVKVGAKVGKEDKIFGTITALQLVEAIEAQQGVTVDRKKVSFNDEVKKLGTYKANLALHKEVNVQITFEVIAD